MEFTNGEEQRASSIDLTVAYLKNGVTTETTGRDVIVTNHNSISLSAAINDGLSPFHAWISIRHIGVKDNDLPDKVSFAESEIDKAHKLSLSAKVPLNVAVTAQKKRRQA